jgi:hypothetical protein
LRSNQETDEGKRCAALANSLTKKAPYKGLGADSEEKHEPVSDIDTVLVDSLKALDPKRPIREADIRTFSLAPSRMFAKADTMGRIESGVAMRRRTFLGVLGGVAVAWPNVVGAQQPTLPTIGFLITGTPPFAGELAAFKKGLAESGFVDGQNLTIEYRWAENRLDRLSAMAVDLVKRQVSLEVVLPQRLPPRPPPRQSRYCLAGRATL